MLSNPLLGTQLGMQLAADNSGAKVVIGQMISLEGEYATVLIGKEVISVQMIVGANPGAKVFILFFKEHAFMIGPARDEWKTLTLADANWTDVSPLEWRNEYGRIWFRGRVTRNTSSFAPNATLFNLGGVNPPAGTQLALIGCTASVAASTPDGQLFRWVMDPSAGLFRSSGTTFTLAIGDGFSLDDVSYPLD